ncbi:hypothetical protein [Abyssalbus ytuae]|uniref:Uncharacterized protein n=1 Tax=Abyssalbus ytuae TaxID=2926907 RepID=A0A9E6ZLR3_9FLAO|nr:hypothetical protein [Abyssalbus ytuae]UOB16595.1 hypothetical protein MQE35_12720 [Abyssalbus ytuae]
MKSLVIIICAFAVAAIGISELNEKNITEKSYEKTRIDLIIINEELNNIKSVRNNIDSVKDEIEKNKEYLENVIPGAK